MDMVFSIFVELWVTCFQTCAKLLVTFSQHGRNYGSKFVVRVAHPRPKLCLVIPPPEGSWCIFDVLSLTHDGNYVLTSWLNNSTARG